MTRRNLWYRRRGRRRRLTRRSAPGRGAAGTGRGRRGRRTPGRSDRAKADEASERLDVTRFAGRRLGSLSGGERQRVRLARALAQEPRVLLLDEPANDLDIGHQQQVLELVDDLRRTRGVTVVSTLHDLTQAGQYGGHLVLLAEGRVEASGAPAAVLTQDLIARVYAARVTVSPGPVVTPVREQPKQH